MFINYLASVKRQENKQTKKECNMYLNQSQSQQKPQKLQSSTTGIQSVPLALPTLPLPPPPPPYTNPFNPSLLRRRFSQTFYKSLNVQKRPRLVKKCGELNISMENVPKHKRRLLSDFFNTILDIKWRWHVLIFLLTFLVSWFIFATIWYLIAYHHDDLDSLANFTNSSQSETTTQKSTTEVYPSSNVLLSESHDQQRPKPKQHMPCVHGIHDFTSALLYSVETQHTIGYGLRYITEECSYAIIFLMLQSCFGIFVQGLVAGVVFAKISRPNKRKRTIIFSHNAVVSERDGKLCFMFKIANVRISQLSDARLKILMIKSRLTSEGEFIPFQSFDMKVGYDWSGNDSVFFPWPKTVEHVIDETSPLYDMCKHAINSSSSQSEASSNLNTLNSCDQAFSQITGRNEDYEIVVILEGNIETTGASCHIRTSYLPQEILFGYRFTPIYPKFTDFEYLFDYSKFDQVEPFQNNLLHLNVAYMNRHLNYICDTKEDKNYQLTYQNTTQKDQINKPNNNAVASLNSILNTFKQHSTVVDETKTGKIRGRSRSGSLNKPVPVNNIKTDDTCDSGVYLINEEKPNKGRFTVVPVNEIKNDSDAQQVLFNTGLSSENTISSINSESITTTTTTTNLTTSTRLALPPIASAFIPPLPKRKRANLNRSCNSSYSEDNANNGHSRTISLPPVYSACELQQLIN